jgi:hypothetical protein
MHAQDISYDEINNTKITTEELGQAIHDIQKLTGKPLEVYGSDACLMSMVEVASEMGSAAKYFVGSQADEPADGWPYNKFLARWVKNPFVDGDQVGKILTEEYFAAYTGGIYGKSEVTFSSLDLSKLNSVQNEMQILSHELLTLSDQQLQTAFAFLPTVQKFNYGDYKDLSDFLLMLKQNSPSNSAAVDSVIASVKNLITLHGATPLAYGKASGISIWVPNNKKEWDFKGSGARYQGLTFHQKTLWGEVLKRLYP